LKGEGVAVGEVADKGGRVVDVRRIATSTGLQVGARPLVSVNSNLENRRKTLEREENRLSLAMGVDGIQPT
jgi:hypothetical protein